ncbi:MAG: branched-chain amino acid ABC transporter permease [Clostridia bacterium]|nr:branched-chain amino acid ABC transporter permease [Clostridia bacterium]
MNKARKTAVNNLIIYALVIVAYVICQIMIDNKMMTRSLRGQLVPICVYIVMAVSLNLTVGISGELSLGHAGFMSVGAFTGIVASTWMVSAFQMDNEILRLIISMIAGGVLAAVAGVLIGIPVLRLRGDYLAIVTLAFGEIIRNVFNCLYFAVDGRRLYISFNNPMLPGDVFVKGPAGATGVDKISTFPMGVILILFTLLVVLNLINSRSGRAIMAIRDSRIAAESVGLNITKYKMMAFVTSAALAGMAGALYGLNYSTVTASQFKFDTSILVLVFVVLGGIGNIGGSVVAAALLTILPELLRAFSDYRMLVYAIVLIVVMLATNSPLLKNIWTGLMRISPLARLVDAAYQLLQDYLPFKKKTGKEGDAA